MQKYIFPHPLYIKDLKDIPERVYDKWGREWLRTVDFNKLPRYQLKVRMCCPKCEEKVLEEIWEVRGVFDVTSSRIHKKVVVTGMPSWAEAAGLPRHGAADLGYLDTREVLRKARKIDCRAKYVALDPPDKPVNPKPDHQHGNNNPKPNQPKPEPTQPKPQHPNGGLVLLPMSYPALELGYGSSSAAGPSYRSQSPFHRVYYPVQDDYLPFYVFLFLILLLSLLVFRK